MERLSVIYATALFELAKEHDAVDEFLSQSVLLRDSLSGPDCQSMLCHPQIPAPEKHEFFRKTFEGKIHENLLGFLFLIADRNREAYLLSALEVLIGKIKQYRNNVTAKVLSAAPVSEKQTKILREMISKKLNKTIELDLKIDPSIIGGPYIYADGYYIDWTVKKRLSDLTVNLKERGVARGS